MTIHDLRSTAEAYLRASILLGIGLGGLIDGIVLHQVLQWHHMLSVPVPPTTLDAIRLNTLADGLFHLSAWVVTLAGALWLAGTQRPDHVAGRLFSGLLIGWGTFNLVEGIVDHYILGIHHVRSGPDAAAYDLGMLLVAGLLVVAGVSLVRRSDLRATRGRSDAARAS